MHDPAWWWAEASNLRGINVPAVRFSLAHVKFPDTSSGGCRYSVHGSWLVCDETRFSLKRAVIEKYLSFTLMSYLVPNGVLLPLRKRAYYVSSSIVVVRVSSLYYFG